MHLLSTCLLLITGRGLDNQWGRHHAFGQKLVSLLSGVSRGGDGTSALRLLLHFADRKHVFLRLLDRLGQRANCSLMCDQNCVVLVLGNVNIGVLLALIDIREVLSAFIPTCRVLLRRVNDLACFNSFLLLFRRLVDN